MVGSVCFAWQGGYISKVMLEHPNLCGKSVPDAFLLWDAYRHSSGGSIFASRHTHIDIKRRAVWCLESSGRRANPGYSTWLISHGCEQDEYHRINQENLTISHNPWDNPREMFEVKPSRPTKRLTGHRRIWAMPAPQASLRNHQTWLGNPKVNRTGGFTGRLIYK